jgi:hypothetical protein
MSIRGYWQDLVKFKNKTLKSDDFKSFLDILFNISAYGILGGLSYLTIVSPSLLIKFIGIGCFLWLFEKKLLEMITQLLGSISIVKVYK